MRTVEDIEVAGKHPRFLNQPARKILFRLGPHIQHGQIILEENGLKHVFGEVSTAYPKPGILKVCNPAFYTDAVFGGVIGITESFIDGRWTTDDLPSLIRIVMHNESLYNALDRGLGSLLQPLRNLFHAFRHNSEKGSRRNIMAHYDLGNDFFSLFLDETMAYSSAYFPTPETSLAEASRAKFDRLCKRLHLQPDDTLLEIGTGWGGFAMYAASEYGCHVTTTTISPSQKAWVEDQIKQKGLQDKITVLGLDYRKLSGQFDKLVSIEMIEAVGHQYLDHFFECCGKLLKPDGLMALQAITVPSRYYAKHKRKATFINQYVFPGSCLPSDIAMCQSITRGSDMELVVKEDITAHYVKTLAIWRSRFMSKLDEVRKFWPGEAFIRTWDLYFASCEAGFAERDIGVAQYVLAKPKAEPRLSYSS
jgi:cyclopropane-fatty-acyl-phospholipid synthase